MSIPRELRQKAHFLRRLSARKGDVVRAAKESGFSEQEIYRLRNTDPHLSNTWDDVLKEVKKNNPDYRFNTTEEAISHDLPHETDTRQRDASREKALFRQAAGVDGGQVDSPGKAERETASVLHDGQADPQQKAMDKHAADLTAERAAAQDKESFHVAAANNSLTDEFGQPDYMAYKKAGLPAPKNGEWKYDELSGKHVFIQEKSKWDPTNHRDFGGSNNKYSDLSALENEVAESGSGAQIRHQGSHQSPPPRNHNIKKVVEAVKRGRGASSNGRVTVRRMHKFHIDPNTGAVVEQRGGTAPGYQTRGQSAGGIGTSQVESRPVVNPGIKTGLENPLGGTNQALSPANKKQESSLSADPLNQMADNISTKQGGANKASDVAGSYFEGAKKGRMKMENAGSQGQNKAPKKKKKSDDQDSSVHWQHRAQKWFE